MNKYLIYTTQGYCEDPIGNEIDNCQVLGRIEATDRKEAIDKFLKDHEWVQRSRYSPYYMSAVQLHNDEVIY